jgi:hypothetical protein
LIELWETFLYMLDAEDDPGATMAAQQQTAALTAAAAAAPSSGEADGGAEGGAVPGSALSEAREQAAGPAAPGQPATATDVALEQDA